MFQVARQRHKESRRRKQALRELRRTCTHPEEFHSFPVFEPTKNYTGPGSAVAPVVCLRCGQQIRG